MSDVALDQPQDVDRDSLHTLPLCILPLTAPNLKSARLIKNARLESVVEFFEGKHTGSGQMDIGAVAREFDWPQTPPHPDLIMLGKLARLNSYDVYSLRILLRQNQIEVNDIEALKLSEGKCRELSEYMAGFTRPLIMQIYGGVDDSLQGFEDILELFTRPDVKEAREKLQTMADKLGIEVQDLPRFLEDYGDIYLSLSYYRQCFELIAPTIEGFVESLGDIRASYQFKNNVTVINACDMMESTIEGLKATITDNFAIFERETANLWDEISADRFQKVEELIRGYHTYIGGVLCALSLKMASWSKLFPHRRAGGLAARVDFILSEMKLGIDKIREIEDQVPAVASLD
jgi:hypothetical protein